MKRRAVLVLSLVSAVFALVASAAWAGPEDEVAATLAQWVAAYTSGNADDMAALYAPEALMFGSLGPRRLDGPQEIRAYYARVFRLSYDRKITLREVVTRVYGDTAVNSGYYQVMGTNKDGNPVMHVARYTAVLTRRDGRWLIADHHHSTPPNPPR